jgi:hypothetical protein
MRLITSFSRIGGKEEDTEGEEEKSRKEKKEIRREWSSGRVVTGGS